MSGPAVTGHALSALTTTGAMRPGLTPSAARDAVTTALTAAGITPGRTR